MIKTSKIIAFAFLTGLLGLTSCQQDAISPSSSYISPEQNIDAQKADGITPLAACSGATGVTVSGTIMVPAGPALGQYCPWGRLTYALCSGAGPTLSLEGQFNSFIRPITSGWFIGTIPLAEYNNTWSTMTITPKAGNTGTDPNVTCSTSGGFSATPNNVVGMDGSFGGFNFGLGYYDYSTGSPIVTQAIVVWTGGSATNPAGATEAYAIEVTGLNPVSGGSFYTSQIVFDYRGAL
jgi:hypothetical protein